MSVLARPATVPGCGARVAIEAGALGEEIRDARTGFTTPVFARLAQQVARTRIILRYAGAILVRDGQLDAPCDVIPVAGLPVQRCGDGVVVCHSGTHSVQATEAETSKGDRVGAGPLEQLGGEHDIAGHSFALGMHGPKLGAAEKVAAIACLLEEHGRAGRVFRDGLSRAMQHTKARTALHGTELTATVEECGRPGRVPFQASTTLVHVAQARAAGPDTIIARALVDLGRGSGVAEDVLSPLDADSKVMACLGIAPVAGVAQLARVCRSSMAAGRYEDRGGDGERGWTDRPSREDGEPGSHHGGVEGNYLAQA